MLWLAAVRARVGPEYSPAPVNRPEALGKEGTAEDARPLTAVAGSEGWAGHWWNELACRGILTVRGLARANQRRQKSLLPNCPRPRTRAQDTGGDPQCSTSCAWAPDLGRAFGVRHPADERRAGEWLPTEHVGAPSHGSVRTGTRGAVMIHPRGVPARPQNEPRRDLLRRGAHGNDVVDDMSAAARTFLLIASRRETAWPQHCVQSGPSMVEQGDPDGFLTEAYAKQETCSKDHRRRTNADAGDQGLRPPAAVLNRPSNGCVAATDGACNDNGGRQGLLQADA